MVRTPPFFPQFGGKTIFGSTFQILLVARFSDIQFLHKNTSINPKSVEFHQCHAKRHSIWFFYHNIKDNDRNLWQHLLTIENTDTDLKVHALHYANELLVRVRLSFQKLSQHLRSTCRNDTKKCLGKELCRVLVVDESTDHDKPHFDLFPTTISTSKKIFFFQSARGARAENSIARHIDLFVLSMRMQIILDSLFVRLGSAPIWGGKKGEIRDWTRSTVVAISFYFAY